MVGSHFVNTTALRCATAGRVDPRINGGRVERFDFLDLADPARVARYVRSTEESCIVNFAARTDVDGVERERSSLGVPEGGPAWIVNALTPGAVATAVQEGGKHLIQISTDFVFDGLEGPYAEDSDRSPLTDRLSWYGWTKSESERLVLAAAPHSTVVRIAYPYRARFPEKLDFARRIVENRRLGRLSPLYADQQITPTWIPDVTQTLEVLLARRPRGVFHVASPDLTTPFEFGSELLRQIEGRDANLEAGRMATANPITGRAPRPLRGGLRTLRLSGIGVSPTGWRSGIRRLVEEEEWA
jgi:dTDP-4-dehydrorhamnose reductase